jgi:molybdate transport system substrate-binding protein
MATIKLLVSNSMRGVMDELIPRFERARGHQVRISYDPAKLMLERIRRGESADVVILGGPAVEELAKEGKVAEASRRLIASCGVGIAVRSGAKKPDIGSVDAFKRALLAARSIAWTQEGASGMYFSKLIERLGIAAEIQQKAVRKPGGLIAEQVVAGEAELAVQQIPELMAVDGVEVVGPLPQELQQVTVSSGGIFTASKQPQAAEELLQFLKTAESAAVLRARGHEPR